MKEKMNRLFAWLNLKKISIALGVLFIVSMLPNWFLAFIARPSGDDYGYSIATHQAWINTHSLIEVFKAGIETTINMCRSWNGDWFSVFIFTLMPEVFVTKSFWIVPIFWTLAMIGATYYLAYEVLCRQLGMKWYEALGITALVLIMCYQWIPSSAIGMYWYVGVIHYIMPHVVAMLMLAFLSRYLRTKKNRYIVYSALGAVAIGGSSYYSVFLVFLIYILVFIYIAWKDKKVFLFLIPMITGCVALYFHVTAPGNAERVGEGLGFSVEHAVSTIVGALIMGMTRIEEYMKNSPFLFVLLAVSVVLIWEALNRSEQKFNFPFPVIWAGYMYGIYAAMFTPEIYANTEISGGPPTMEYFTFILTFISAVVYLEGWLIRKLHQKQKLKSSEWYHQKLTIPFLICCGVITLLFHGMLKDNLFMESCEYIFSGQAADYKEQMDSQLEVLLDESIKDAVVCPTNDEQGPLMHMPVTDKVDAFTNQVVAGFYGKESVKVYVP